MKAFLDWGRATSREKREPGLKRVIISLVVFLKIIELGCWDGLRLVRFFTWGVMLSNCSSPLVTGGWPSERRI